MKKIVLLYIFSLILIFNCYSQSKTIFLSIEGSFNYTNIYTNYSRTTIFSLYASPAAGYSLNKNFNIGLMADIYHLKTKDFNQFRGESESSDNLYYYGVFIERIISLSDVFKLRIRPLLIYRRENTQILNDEDRLEFRFAPGIIYIINKNLEVYANFKGMGIADDFYFDLGLDQLNLGLQFNLNFE